MRCERCRARIRGATWYCPNCGAPVRDLNVADSVAGLSPRRLWERGLPLLFLAAAAALLLAGGGWLWGRLAGPAAELLGRLRWGGEGAAIATPAAGSEAAAPTSPAAGGGSAANPGAGATLGAAAEASAYPTGLPPRPGVPVWRLRRPAAPPVIDGLLDDWQAPLIEVRPLPLEAVVFGAEAWSGKDDLGGEALGAWDERALYLAFALRDEAFAPVLGGGRLYLSDSLELQLDSQLLADWERADFDADDWHIGLSPGDLRAAAAGSVPPAPPIALQPEAWVWRPQSRQGSLALPMAAALRPGGYALELALPWEVLGLKPQAGLVLGLSLSASDNDRDAPAQESMVSSSPLRRWDDPRTMGLLILDP